MHKVSILLLALPLIALVACQSAPAKKDKPAPTMEAPKEATMGGEPKEMEAPKAPALPPCEEEDDTCRVDRLGDTSVGFLKQGLPAKVIWDKLGPTESSEEPFEEGASGDILAPWGWASQGVEANMLFPNPEADPSEVRDFTVKAPFQGKTARGIGIGSSEEEVRAAYADCIDPRAGSPGRMVVAGSVYGGMFFDIQDGKVSSIFVGAGAE